MCAWLGSLEGKISRFFFFLGFLVLLVAIFFFFAGVLVELKVAVIVVMVWLCRDDDCGLVVP